MDFEDSDDCDEDWSKPVNEGDGSFCSITRNSPKVSDSNLPKKISADIEHPRTIIHIDMDCFYAQVEMIKNPSLRHVPLGIQQKYIIVTCNYPARALGVTKLMTVKDAKNKCPSLRMVCGEDLTEYRKMSYRISEYLLKYTKKVERLGFDENFLDVSELINSRLNIESPGQFSGHIYGVEDTKSDISGLKQCSCGCYQRIKLGSNIAQEIRDSLYNDLGVTSCSGISYNKLLAKLAGEKHKPNQQTTLLPEYTLQLLHSLPSTRNIPGIGSGMSKRLSIFDINSVVDLYNYDQDKLTTEFGQQTAKFLKDLSAGVDNTPVVRYGLPQSISDEDSYRDLNNIKDIEKQIDILVGNVLKRVIEDGRSPQTLRVTIRKSILSEDKQVLEYGTRESRQCPISHSIFNNKDTSTWKTPIVELAISLFNKMVDLTQPIHLTLINICFTKFLKTSSHDISTFFSSPNSKPTQSHDDEFFSQRTNNNKVSPAKQIASFFGNTQSSTVSKEEKSGNVKGKSNGVMSFFKNCGKRKDSESENNNVDTKRAKTETINSCNTSELQIPDTSKLQDLDIDVEVFNQLPPNIQKEILNTHNMSQTAQNPLKSSVNVVYKAKSETKSKAKVGIASFFNKSPKALTKITTQTQDTSHCNTLAKQSSSSHQNPEPTFQSKRSTPNFEPLEQSETSSVKYQPEGKGCTLFTEPFESSSNKNKLSGLCDSASSSNQQNVSLHHNESENHQQETKTLQIPPNIDHSVFVTLPPEIQNELISEWKASKNNNIAVSKKPKANTGILEYFNKK